MLLRGSLKFTGKNVRLPFIAGDALMKILRDSHETSNAVCLGIFGNELKNVFDMLEPNLR